MVNATDIGFSTDPTFDNTPAWNAMVASGGPNWVWFDGSFYFKTKPNAINRPIRLEGTSINVSNLIRDYVPATPDEAFIHSYSTLNMDRFGILAKLGTTGDGVKLEGLSASGSILSNLYMTAMAGAQWRVTLQLTSNDPLGIRTVYLSNLEIFAANAHLLWGVNVKGLTLNNVNCYPAGGTVNYATIQHNAAGRSANILWSTRYLDTLYVYNTDNLTITKVNPVAINISGSTNIRQL